MLFFLWMLSLSLKFEIDNASYPPVFIPDRINLGQLRRRHRIQAIHDLFLQHA